MAEVRRFDASPAADASDRDSEIEALLVGGLDRYFSGDYDEAIHLWTRVLFLDRSHARARAYIDRARSALSEQQRRADELLNTSRELLDQGDVAAARQLLAQVIATTGEDDHASALRHRLERFERATDDLGFDARGHFGPQARGISHPPPVPGWTWRRRSTALIAVASLLVLVSAIVLAIAFYPSLPERFGFAPAGARITSAVPSTKVPTLTTAEVALVRAQTLYERGRLAEALVVLDRVSSDSPQKQQADTLRRDIQRLLLASARDRSRTR